MILITGGAGYIGSHTLLSVVDAGHEPVTVDNLFYGHRQAVLEGHFVHADLGDKEALSRLFETFPIDAVIHFAAFLLRGRIGGIPREVFQQQPGKWSQPSRCYAGGRC